LPKEIHSVLVARIKILSSLEIDEHFKPQDGRFKFVTEDQMVDVRVSVMPTFYGERVVFRLLKGSFGPLTLPELGISDESLKLVESNISKTFGMFLVTGPTGSGKTTTLYAILHILNTPAVNIATVEDPIEYAILRVNQTQVNPKAGITFASGLKSLVRQNPDILMVGEIRDMETADISIHASLTGHLLLSTLHASDAPTAIPRLINIGVEPYLLASTLNAIIAQRLIRKICQYCVESYEVPKDAMALIEKELNLSRAGIAKENFEIPHRLFRGKGCEKCNHSGFAGQSGIFEVFSVDTDIRDMITRNASLTDLKKAAIQKGMVPMFEDGLRKAEKGITSIEEVLRVVRE
jgi:type II secretory ATPase GspE/PulE/Tfp pilus assembly ATPase PilB-like protein